MVTFGSFGEESTVVLLHICSNKQAINASTPRHYTLRRVFPSTNRIPSLNLNSTHKLGSNLETLLMAA